MNILFPGVRLVFPVFLAAALLVFSLSAVPAAKGGEVVPASGAGPEGENGEKEEEGGTEWLQLAPGMEFAVLEARVDNVVRIAILRIDPSLYDFSLHSITWEGEPPRTISEWAFSQGLVAAINAGMYLPDGRTNTGYMRRGKQSNNSRIAEKFGSFFVSGPRAPGLPGVTVLDRAVAGWEALLPKYENVVQNFRLLGPDGAQLWPEDGPMHPIAAVGVDRRGNILFLHCRTSVTVHNFVRALLIQPALELAAAMYVEGGAQAAMTVRLPKFSKTWVGQHPADIFFGSAGAQIPLPNIIGVRPRPLP